MSTGHTRLCAPGPRIPAFRPWRPPPSVWTGLSGLLPPDTIWQEGWNWASQIRFLWLLPGLPLVVPPLLTLGEAGCSVGACGGVGVSAFPDEPPDGVDPPNAYCSLSDTPLSLVQLMTHRTGESTKVCYFQPLSSRLVCYAAIDS